MIHVPARFDREVRRHAIGVTAIDRYPLLLIVQGPPGDGKSFQIAHVLERAKFGVLRMSSSLLAGSFESESVEAAKRVYRRADEFYLSGGYPAIVFEDFDLSPATRRTETNYTVNSQLLNGFLMNLADDVGSCDVGTIRRYPIFLTGNDFTSMYAPLSRAGRCNFFTWDPSLDEKSAILYSALVDRGVRLTLADTKWLTKRYQRSPISAFVATLDEWASHVALDHVESTGELSVKGIRKAIASSAPDVAVVDQLMRLRTTPGRQPARSWLKE